MLGDKIYGTHENREYLKNLSIQFSGKPLGRPQNLTKSEIGLERRKRKEEQRIRNRVESKFGEGKRRYSLDRQVDVSDCIKAKTKHTSESWIAAVFFVMNLAAWLRRDLFLSFFKLLEIVKVIPLKVKYFYQMGYMMPQKCALKYQENVRDLGIRRGKSRYHDLVLGDFITLRRVLLFPFFVLPE